MSQRLPKWLRFRAIGVLVLSAMALYGLMSFLNRPTVPSKSVRALCENFLLAMKEGDYHRVRGVRVLAQGGGSVDIEDSLSSFAERYGRVDRFTYKGSSLANRSSQNGYDYCYATFAVVLDSIPDARMRFGLKFDDAGVRMWGADLSDPDGTTDYMALRFEDNADPGGFLSSVRPSAP